MEDAGSLRASIIDNTFQTDPSQSEPQIRHPWALTLETSVASHLSVDAALSDGIGLGTKAALVREADGHFDLSLGFDELLYPTDRDLFGDAPHTGAASTGRAWLAAAQTWDFVRARAAVSVEPTSGSYHVVPYLAFETAFDSPVSIGWESRWESTIWRQDIGASVAWRSFHVAGGLTEFQAWILRGLKPGWFPTPPVDATTGIDNPGWWVSVTLDIPNFSREKPAPPPPISVSCPAPVVDSQALRSVAELFQARSLREDVAELAARSRSDAGSDPLAMAILRRRILSEGPAARALLWRICDDPSAALDERVQAMVTLSEGISISDTSALEVLSRDPAPALRLESAVDLGHIGAGPSYRILGRLAQDPDESVRESAKSFLVVPDRASPQKK